MAQIITLLTAAIVSDLTDANIGTGDDAEAGLVREGRLQDDPSDFGISILVHSNDPEKPGQWTHERFKPPAVRWSDYLNVIQGLFEIGGGDVWIRRMTIELKVHLVGQGYTLTEAQAIMNLVLGRCEDALRESTRIPAVEDEFGEQVSNVSKFGIAKSEMLTRGGPESDWIGAGKIWLEVYTERP